MLTGYFARVRKVLSKNPAPPELHRLRLETKRLRYTLELFRPCYGPGLETRIAELRDLQQLLGEINDNAATERLLSKMMRQSPQKSKVEAYLVQQADAKARAFRKHWTEVFDAAGREHWWTSYLEHPAKSS